MHHMAPSKIFFSQDSIKARFNGGKNDEHNGKLIGETLDDLVLWKTSRGRKGITVKDVPLIKVVHMKGEWVTCDNRRLWVFKHFEVLGGCAQIPVVLGQWNPKRKFSAKYRQSDIKIRGDGNPGGIWYHLYNEKPEQYENFLQNPNFNPCINAFAPRSTNVDLAPTRSSNLLHLKNDDRWKSNDNSTTQTDNTVTINVTGSLPKSTRVHTEQNANIATSTNGPFTSQTVSKISTSTYKLQNALSALETDPIIGQSAQNGTKGITHTSNKAPSNAFVSQGFFSPISKSDFINTGLDLESSFSTSWSVPAEIRKSSETAESRDFVATHRINSEQCKSAGLTQRMYQATNHSFPNRAKTHSSTSNENSSTPFSDKSFQSSISETSLRDIKHGTRTYSDTVEKNNLFATRKNSTAECKTSQSIQTTGQAASIISSSKAKTTIPTSNEMSLSGFYGMRLQSPSKQYLLRNYTPASSRFVSYATNVSTSRRNRSEIVERRHTPASQRNSIQKSSNKTNSPASKETSSATFPSQSFHSSISGSRLMNTKPVLALSDSDSSYISSEMRNHLEMAVKRGFSTPQGSNMVQDKNTQSGIIHQHNLRLSQIQRIFNPDEMSFRNG